MSTSVAFGSFEWSFHTHIDRFTEEQGVTAYISENYSHGSEGITISCINNKLIAVIHYQNSPLWIGGDKNRQQQGDVEVITQVDGKKPVKLPGHSKGDLVTIGHITKEFIALFQSKYPYTKFDLSGCGVFDDNCPGGKLRTKRLEDARKEPHINFRVTDNVNTIFSGFILYGSSEAIAHVLKACPNGFEK
jgi:hypothetical protein